MKLSRPLIILSIISILAAVPMAVSAFSFSNGNSNSVSNGKDSDATIRRKAKIGKFKSINASQAIKVIYTQDKNPGYAEVATTPSAKDYLEVYVKDECLVVKYNNHHKKIKGPSIVRVSSPELKEVSLSSAASFTATSPINQSSTLSVSLSSAGKADFGPVKCKKMEIDLSSCANVNVTNLNADLDIDLSSAASVNISKASGTRADIDLSSAASVKIGQISMTRIDAEASSAAKATIDRISASRVEAEASSGAKITLAGECVALQRESSSGGKVDTSRLRTTDGKHSGNRDHRKHNRNSGKNRPQGNLRIP